MTAPASPPDAELDATVAPPRRGDPSTAVLATLAVIAALWWGQSFLIPLTAGVMLAMLVMPLQVLLQRLTRSAIVAAVLSLLAVLGAVGIGAVAFGGQLVRVAERVPEMISMAAQHVARTDNGSESVFKRARDALYELDRAADLAIAPPALPKPVRPGRRAAAEAAAAASAASAAASGPAEAAVPNDNITESATEVLRESAVVGSGALLVFAGQLSIIVFIAFFVLNGGRSLTERFLGLWSRTPRGHERARRALLETGRQIRLYGAVLVITNTVIGVAVGVVFSLAGLPDAAGWGAAAAVLHVVPYLGMALLTVLGAAEAFLVHGTVGAALAMAAFLVVLSTLLGTVMTAWLQSRAAKMNAAAVFIGLVFWGALWGLWGLFLGPALVVLMKVVAGHTRAGHRLAKLMQG